jgi:hypothetical protein
MATTYEKIATTTLGSNNASISFTSIGSGYTDLRLVVAGSSTGTSSQYPKLQFNADSSALYSFTYLRGNGTAANSSRNTGASWMEIQGQDAGIGANPFMATVDLFSYAGSTFKTCLIEFSGDQNGSGQTVKTVGLYRSTSAITGVSLTNSGSYEFTTGFTATLYGILKA